MFKREEEQDMLNYQGNSYGTIKKTRDKVFKYTEAVANISKDMQRLWYIAKNVL
ncbi:hypothetical protein [Rickettsia bellii]|nr:hypothetical protein [Rickettsia bellii]ABV79529.1 hypothetical protein A1I_06045 [Rickettsia bellii OSU 85-389]